MSNVRRARQRQRRIRMTLIISGGVIFLLTLVYLLFSLYFKNHFYFRTEVNGLKVGGMSAEDAEGKVAEDIGDYLLTIFDRDGNKYHIVGRDINSSYVPDGALGEALESQNMFAWIPSLFKENQIDVDTPIIYDKEKLATAVAALPCFQEETIIEPVNAYIEKTDTGFVIVPEVMGTTLDLEKTVTAVEAAVTAGKGDLTLTDEDYVNPVRYSDSPEILSALEQLEASMGASITYEIADYHEELIGNQILEMIQIDQELNITLDDKKVTDFVQGIATKYNTYGDRRQFVTSSGDTVEIGGGDYGWVVDKDKEVEQLKADVLSGTSVSREPVYSQRAKVEGLNDIGTTYVEIDYTKQHMWYYEEGQLILESDIVSGNIAAGNGSPDGVFKIVYKQSPAVLKGEDYESDVSYFMPFAYNVGIHDASWRSKFGREYYKTSGSHGCINAPGQVAEDLYQHIKVDTPVIAYYREPVELTAENCRISNAFSYVKPEEEPGEGTTAP